MISCSEEVQERFSRMIQHQRFLKERVKMKDGERAGENAMYLKRVVELLKREIEM